METAANRRRRVFSAGLRSRICRNRRRYCRNAACAVRSGIDEVPCGIFRRGARDRARNRGVHVSVRTVLLRGALPVRHPAGCDRLPLPAERNGGPEFPQNPLRRRRNRVRNAGVRLDGAVSAARSLFQFRADRRFVHRRKRDPADCDCDPRRLEKTDLLHRDLPGRNFARPDRKARGFPAAPDRPVRQMRHVREGLSGGMHRPSQRNA